MSARVALLTEPGSQLEHALEAEGLEVHCHPVRPTMGPLPKALIYVAEHLGLFQRVILDSPWSARLLAEAFRQAGTWPKAPLLGVDERTRDAMEALHWPAMVLPTERLNDTHLAFIRQRGQGVPESISDCDELTVIDVPVEEALAGLEGLQADAVIVCAPSEASVLSVAMVAGLQVIAAGPTTAHALEHRGVVASEVAAKPTTEAIVEATLRALKL